MNNLEKVLKALANKRRLAIIKYLKRVKEASVGEIAAEIGLSFKSTSRHVRILLTALILERDQRALSVYYYVSKDTSALLKLILSML